MELVVRLTRSFTPSKFNELLVLTVTAVLVLVHP